MKKTILFMGFMLLLSACSTVTNLDKTTTLDYWNLGGKVKSMSQRMYFAADKDGEVVKRTMYDSDVFKLNSFYYTFDPDLRANPYLVDVTFTPTGKTSKVVFLNMANKATSPTRTNATVVYNYNEKEALTMKTLFDADNEIAIQSTYSYDKGKCLVKKLYRDEVDMESVELLCTTVDEAADAVEIFFDKELQYTIANTRKKGLCLKSEMKTPEGELVLTIETKYDKKENVTKRTISSYSYGEPRTRTEEYTYNKENRPLTAHFDLYNSKTDEIKYTYDESGKYYTNVLMEKGRLTFTYEYTLDEQGNWTKTVRNRIKRGNPAFLMMVERDITYYE